MNGIDYYVGSLVFFDMFSNLIGGWKRKFKNFVILVWNVSVDS